MPYETDVIVVGAGPAGSTAAKLLADRGRSVTLLDRAAFPRHKTCASWINRLAFVRFPYLQPHLTDLVETPFYGVTFHDPCLEREGRYRERTPSGYLSLRTKFDDGLRRIAIAAGAEFHGCCNIVNVQQDSRGVTASTAAGNEFRGRVLIGADGASSRVAMCAGLRRGWVPGDYVICANADIPLDARSIRCFYGERFPFRVYLQYRQLRGYGWVFPKRRHVCVGIGGLLANNRDIRPLFRQFFKELGERRQIPEALKLEDVHYDVDPVGAVHRLKALAQGRILLIGDAAGFVSGSTGEGIYPGMVSAEVAVSIIHHALSRNSVESGIARFDCAWRSELASYVKRLPGGAAEDKTQGRLGLIFRSRFAACMAGRIFLYGETPSLKTAARTLWSGSLWRLGRERNGADLRNNNQSGCVT